MRTLFAFAVFAFLGSSQLTAQTVETPPARGATAPPRVLPPSGASPRGTASRGAPAPGTTRGAASRGAAQGQPANPIPGVYLVTFRPGTPAADRATVVQGHGARLRAVYDTGDIATVEVPDSAVLARLRNDPRILGVFANQKILLEQGRGGSGKPKPPESLAAVAGSPTEINLSWIDASNNENGFAIERCTGSGCGNFTEIFRTSANVVIFNDTGRSPQTTYRYRVMAFNASDTSKYSNTAEATTPAVPTAPTAPSNLTTTPLSHTQVDLAWSDNSNNEDGFRIERCTGSGCVSFVEIQVTGPNAVAFSDSGRAPMTVYRYRLRAYNAVGNSAYSSVSETTTLPPPPPSAPTGLTATPTSSTQIDLSWVDTSPSEDGFRIERCQGTGCTSFTEVLTVGPDVVAYSDTGRSPGTDYRYRVLAYNAGGNSAYSNVANATTLPPPPPSAPSGLTATPISHTQVNLSWTDNSSSEDGFKVERCQGAGCTSFAEIGSIAANVVTFTDSGGSASTDYRYRVLAFNAGGNSGFSNVASATTLAPPPPSAPSGLTATPISSTQVDLSWTDNSSSEDGFKIERCQGAGCTSFTEIGSAAANAVTFSDTGRAPLTDYRYQVLAFNAGGNSGFSNIASTTTLAPPSPSAPSGLTATPISSTQVDLIWTDSSGNEDGFKIERCQGAGCTSFAEIGSALANVTTFTDSGRSPSTDYRYRVLAYNAGGNSAYSNIASATTLPPPPPGAPTGLTATPISHTEIALSWTDTSSSEDGFKIERCQGAGCTSFAEIGSVLANVVAFSDTGRSPSTDYRYRVMAYNDGGNSAYSNIASATTLPPPPPSAPSGLTAMPVSHTQVDLSWSDNSGSEDGFKIERCQGAGCTTFTEIGSVLANVSSFSDTGRSPMTDYRYRVLAYNAGGNSAYSNIANATTLPPPPPTAPGGLTATPISSTQVDLSWTDNSIIEDGFKIERCQGAGCTTFTEIGSVLANVVTFSDTGRSPSTDYRYRVLAYNAGGNSAYSNIANATTLAPPPPAAPSGLTATPISSTQVNLSWTDNSGSEDGFRIERCQGAGCTTFAEIAAVGPNVLTYNDTGRAPSTDYRYRVLAYNAGGNSAYSNIANATTLAPPPPAAPSGLTATPISSTQVDLSWTDNSTSEDGFRIERCQGTGCTTFAEVAAVGPNVLTYSDTGRSPSTDYRYRLLAFNGGGNSAYSNIANATTPAAPPAVPAAPSGLTATATSFNQVELSWTDNSSNESGFRIERCTGPMSSCSSFTQIAQVALDISALTDLGTQGQTTYTYRVRAFNSSGQSAYSNSAQVTTPAAPPTTQVVPAGVQRIGAAPGALTWTGTDVGVAVIDTGLDFAHADLQLQAELPGTNSFNATAPGTTCQDIHGHGTHVAGIIGAKNNLIDVVGVAPNATIYCVAVFEPDPVEGVSATDESVIAGLNWVLTHANTVTPHIRVVNMSLGRAKVFEDNDPNHPLRVAVRALYNAGISVVVAAGNDPETEVMDQVPAFYPEVMAVASTTAQDGVNGYDDLLFPACAGLQPIKKDSASYFTTDGRFISGTGVTISAPGGTQEDMYDFEGSCFLEPIGILSLQAGGGTVELSGTSMASPHVAGVVALMWQKELSLGSNLAPETARTRIRSNSIRRGTAPLDSLLEEYTFDGEREGVIWAPAALLDAPPPPVDAPPTVTITSPANNASFASGQTINFAATATDPENGNIAGSLAWTSDIQGPIGNGPSFSRTLNSGNHVITASVVDSGGNATGASVSITIGSAQNPTTVHAASVTYQLIGSTLKYTVKLVNEFGGPVAGASIRVSLYEWVYTGNIWFSNGVTDSQGNATFQRLIDYGCYTTGVENVTAPGLTWVQGTPSNNYCRL